MKWAGGKTQLLKEITSAFPPQFITNSFTYIEPFVGSGAVLFWVLQNAQNLEKVVINDINQKLINTYVVIKKNPEKLISVLSDFQEEFYSLSGSQEKKRKYYYDKRTKFNLGVTDKVIQAALFIFLNRTCFNGLYRTNKKGEFNVPMGSYKRPAICNKQNLLSVSEMLQRVTIISKDFESTLDYAGKNTLFYFDPPYKPISQTSSFNSYSKDGFSDDEQIRLSHFCSKLDRFGHRWILSNSYVKGVNSENNFFDHLYAQFEIERVNARRNINSNANKRGKLKEYYENIKNTLERLLIRFNISIVGIGKNYIPIY